MTVDVSGLLGDSSGSDEKDKRSLANGAESNGQTKRLYYAIETK